MGDDSKESKDPSFPPKNFRLSLLSLFKRERCDVKTLFIKEEAPDYTYYAQSKEAGGEPLSFCDPNYVNGAQENDDNENLCVPSNLHEKSRIKFPGATEELNQDLFDEAVCDKRHGDKLEKCLPNICFDGNFLKSNAENIVLKSFEESSCSENLPEEYLEVNGQYLEASSLPFSEEEDLKEIEDISDSDEQYSVPMPSCVDEGLSEAKNVPHFEYYSNVPAVEHHGWSCVIETEEERNQMYDRWISDIESWERNRLMWLDNVALSEDFNLSHNKDRTFLVKAENVSNMSDFEPLSQCKVLDELNTETDNLISNHGKVILQEDVNQTISYIPIYKFTDRNLWSKFRKWPKPKSTD